MIFPSFPLSSPRITRTVSPLTTCIRTRSAFRACRLAYFFRSVARYLWTRISDHLRRQRDDLHELLLAQLARHRPEDARRPRLALLVDDHDRVLVEPDVAAVLAPGLLRRAHHHRARD